MCAVSLVPDSLTTGEQPQFYKGHMHRSIPNILKVAACNVASIPSEQKLAAMTIEALHMSRQPQAYFVAAE